MAAGYKALNVYRLAHRLAIEVHRMTLEELPDFEMEEEGSQIRKSSKSVVTNFVEGYGRRFYKGDYLRFLTYAIASCDETKEHVELLTDTGSLTQARGEYFLREYEQLGRNLYRYAQSVAEQHLSGFPPTQAKNHSVQESQAAYGSDDSKAWETWLREYAAES